MAWEGTFIVVSLGAALIASGAHFFRNSRRSGAETGLDDYLPAELAVASGLQRKAIAANSNADSGNVAAGSEARWGGKRGCVAADRLRERDIAHRREAQ